MHIRTRAVVGAALGAALLAGCAVPPRAGSDAAREAAGSEAESAERWIRAGADARRAGDLDRAEAAYRRALEIDADSAAAREGLGVALLARGRFALAEPVLEGALAIEPARPESLAAMGVLLDALERHDEARARYAEAMEIAGRTASLLNNVGYSHYLEGDLAAAADALEEAVGVDSEYARAWSNLALVRYRARDDDGALDAFSRTGGDHRALNNLGYLHLLTGDERAAGATLRRSSEVAPSGYERAERNLDTLDDARLRRALGLDRVREELALAARDAPVERRRADASVAIGRGAGPEGDDRAETLLGSDGEPPRPLPDLTLVPFDGTEVVAAPEREERAPPPPPDDLGETAPAADAASAPDAALVGRAAEPASDIAAPAEGADADDPSADEPIASPSPALVRRVQRELGERGFDVGPADGSAGPRTVRAIRLFKIARRMTVNGDITPRLIDELGLDRR